MIMNTKKSPRIATEEVAREGEIDLVIEGTAEEANQATGTTVTEEDPQWWVISRSSRWKSWLSNSTNKDSMLIAQISKD